MPNATIEKFEYPETLLAEYDHWVALIRPAQVTVGSAVIACKEDAEAFPDVSAEAFRELRQVTSDLEAALARCFSYDKINYLMLMMVDRQVHFHVIPRYSSERTVAGITFRDGGWPRHPVMAEAPELSGEQLQEIRAQVRGQWPGA